MSAPGNVGPMQEGRNYRINVEIDPEYEGLVEAEALERLARYVLREEDAQGPLEVGVVVTTDEEVHRLNREYLGHDYKTDVISFGMEGSEPFVTPEERAPYLGDVVISYDRASEQAPEYGHTTGGEVATLLVHGLLHLLGYNDAHEEERDAMHARQDELLRHSGF